MRSASQTLLLAGMLLSGHVAGAQTATLANATSPPHNQLLVEVVYRGLRLDSNLTVLADNDGKRYVPLRRLALDAGFRIQCDTATQTAHGFLASPREEFQFDARTGYAKSGLSAIKIDAGMCFVEENDIYVEAMTASKMFNVSFAWDENQLELTLTSDRPLHIVPRGDDVESLPAPEEPAPKTAPITTPYRLWAPPQLSVRIRSVVDPSGGDLKTQTVPSVTGFGDLLYMGAQYQVTTDYQGRPVTMLTLGRSDATGKLLGPLRATRFQVGDIILPPVALISTGRTGFGFSFTNHSLEDNSSRMQSIEGECKPNSRVELYREGDYLADTVATKDGHYSFSNVRCLGGANEMLIVAISPTGDISEHRTQLYGETLGLKPGEVRYSAFAGRSRYGRNALFVFQNQNDLALEAGVQLEKQLSKSTWADASLTQQGDTRYLGASLSGWMGKNLGKVEGTISDRGVPAAGVELSRRVGSTNVGLSHEISFGEIRDLRALGSGITSYTRLGVSGGTTNNEIPMNYGLSLDRYNGSSPTTLVRGLVGMVIGDLAISNSVTTRLDQVRREALGTFQVRRNLGTSYSRLEVGYGFGTDHFLQYGRFLIDAASTNSNRIQYGIQHQEGLTSSTSLFGTFYRSFGAFSLGLNVSTSLRKTTIGLLLSTGVGDFGVRDGYDLVPAEEVGTALAEVRVYLDRNMSGKFDEGDTLLPNIGLRVNDRTVSETTGKSGVCIIHRLSPDRTALVTLDEDTLADPSWQCAGRGVVVIPRVGAKTQLDLGVIATAELDGVLHRPQGMSEIEAEGLVLRVITSDGYKVASGTTDPAGNFFLTRIPPGTYTFEVIGTDGKVWMHRSVILRFGQVIKDYAVDLTGSTR